jgi:Flp pilus assembly pilin Flp
MTNTKKLIVDSRGAGAQEYLIAAVLVGVVGVGGFTTLGGSMKSAIGGEGESGVVQNGGAGAMVVSSEAGSCALAEDPAKCMADLGIGGGGPSGVDPSVVTGNGGATTVDPGATNTSNTTSNDASGGGSSGKSGNGGKSGGGKSGGGKSGGGEGCGFLGHRCAMDALGVVVDTVKPSSIMDRVLPGDGFVGEGSFLDKLPGGGFGDDSLLTRGVHALQNVLPGGGLDCALILMPVGPLACTAAMLGDDGKASKTSARRTGWNAHKEAELDGAHRASSCGSGLDAVLCNAAEKARVAGQAVSAGAGAAFAGLFTPEAATAPGADPGGNAAGGGSAGGGTSGNGAIAVPPAPPPPPPLPPEEEIDVDGDGQPDTGVVTPGTDDGTVPVGSTPGTPATPVDPGPGGTPPVGSGTTDEPVVNDPTIGGPTDDGTPTGATDVTPTAPVDSPVGPNTQVVGPFFEGPGHIDDPTIDENNDGILDNDATPAGYADDPTLDENNDGIFDNDGIAVDSDGDGIADGTLDENGVIDTGAGQGAQGGMGTPGGGATNGNCRGTQSGNPNGDCSGSGSGSGKDDTATRRSHPGR